MNFFWVCAAGLLDPVLVNFGQDWNVMGARSLTNIKTALLNTITTFLPRIFLFITLS